MPRTLCEQGRLPPNSWAFSMRLDVGRRRGPFGKTVWIGIGERIARAACVTSLSGKVLDNDKWAQLFKQEPDTILLVCLIFLSHHCMDIYDSSCMHSSTRAGQASNALAIAFR